MCTVTYIPTETGFLLTSNRDEQVSRPALPPMKYKVHGQTVFFPKEKSAEGTWISTAENLFSLCLLNGGFEKHVQKPPYRKSRGLVLLDFFGYNDVEAYAEDYNFDGIEPFTLIIVYCKGERVLHRLVWNGSQVHLEEKSAQKPHIWSSSTLYDGGTRQEREDWFFEFMFNNPYATLDDALFFHHFGGGGDHENSIVMQREAVQTISITAIEADATGKRIVHEDLIDKKLFRCRVY